MHLSLLTLLLPTRRPFLDRGIVIEHGVEHGMVWLVTGGAEWPSLHQDSFFWFICASSRDGKAGFKGRGYGWLALCFLQVGGECVCSPGASGTRLCARLRRLEGAVAGWADLFEGAQALAQCPEEACSHS